MRLGVFGYDFPHWKTQQGLTNLYLRGFLPDMVFLQPWQELDVPSSPFGIPEDRTLMEPQEVADRYQFPWMTTRHNSTECQEVIQEHDLDVGVIFGARILAKATIGAFHAGVINCHPGILPENRGLFTVEQAVLNDWPQGSTVHWIDGRIDRGLIIAQEEIPVYDEDTVTTIQRRLQETEQRLLLEVLKQLQHRCVHGAQYNQPLTEEEIQHFPAALEDYTACYPSS